MDQYALEEKRKDIEVKMEKRKKKMNDAFSTIAENTSQISKHPLFKELKSKYERDEESALVK